MIICGRETYSERPARSVLAFLAFGALVVAVASMTVAPASGASGPPAVADANPPTGEVLYPLPGTWTYSANPTLRVRFADPDGIVVSSIRMDVDGLPLTLSTPSPGTVVVAYGYAPATLDGPHAANASASDQLGNGPTVLSWTFSVDTTIPVVVITSPSGNPVLADGSVTLAWTGTDTGSGIDRYNVRLDDGPWFSVGTATTFLFHNLTPGVHYFWVTAYDVAGNYNYYSDQAIAIATVPAPPPSGPPGTPTTQVTVVVPEQIPSWAVALLAVNLVEAAAIAWLAAGRRRGPSGGSKPGP